MTTFVVVGTIVNFIIGWAWYTYLFPQAQIEFGGKPSGRQLFTYAVALVIFTVALGTFLQNRHVLGISDALRVGFKVWVGFVLPIALSWWATTRKSLWVLVADAGQWLVVACVLSLLAVWMLL